MTERRACAVATNAVDAIRAHAFGPTRTDLAERLLAIAIAVASIVAVDVARRIDARWRIGRCPGHATRILRARISIHGNIARQNGCHDIAITVAFDNLAITRGLSIRQISAGGRKRETTDVANARPRLAKIVHAWALTCRHTPDAVAYAITNLSTTARKILHFRWMRRSAIGAHVFRTCISVDRQVRIVGQRGRARVAITNDLLAIACRLENGARQRVRSLIRNLALIVDATALLTFGFDDVHAMTRLRAFDTRTITIANLEIAWYTVGCGIDIGIAGHSGSTGIGRARIVVIRHVRVVIDDRCQAIVANAELAIAYDRRNTRRRNTIEVRIDARAARRIAQIVGARKLVVAFQVVLARNDAHSCVVTFARFCPLAARGILRQNFILWHAGHARIRSARVVVIDEIKWIVLRQGFSCVAQDVLAIRRSLRGIRRRTTRLLRVYANERLRGTQIGRARIAIVTIGIHGASFARFDRRRTVVLEVW